METEKIRDRNEKYNVKMGEWKRKRKGKRLARADKRYHEEPNLIRIKSDSNTRKGIRFAIFGRKTRKYFNDEIKLISIQNL